MLKSNGFTLDDLDTGLVVELANGARYVKISDYLINLYGSILYAYDEDGIYQGEGLGNFDIVAVYDVPEIRAGIQRLFGDGLTEISEGKENTAVWKRREV